jgi:hypothetical protein
MQKTLLRVVPTCFCIGAAMELFMIKTGFYEIVSRKEGERLATRLEEEDRMKQRMEKLNIRFAAENESRKGGGSL